MTFTLLHTNDLHNRLSQAQAQRLRLLRESLGDHGLLVDAGDAVGAGNMTFYPGGEPILDLMTQTGYAVMTVGNREFHVSRYGFHCKLSRARFPVLCANVRSSHASSALTGEENTSLPMNLLKKDPPVLPYYYHEMSGWRVLFFGLTVPMVTERMLSRVVSAYIFADPIATAAELVPRLRQQYSPDLLVALTHIGLRQDRRLAEAVSGIDLIIGGHSHDTLEHGEQVGETLICQTGSHARNFGRVQVEKRDDGRLVLSASLEPL